MDESGADDVKDERAIDRLFEAITAGDRIAARTVITEVKGSGVAAEELTQRLFWPVLETSTKLFSARQLSPVAYHYATRLLRTLADQAQSDYEQRERRDRKVLMFTGGGESDDLSGLIMADLLEADGYSVYYGGSGIANDEILAEVGRQRPDVVIMLASAPIDVESIQDLITRVRAIGACPDLQIVAAGRAFHGAKAAMTSVGVDVHANEPREIIEALEGHTPAAKKPRSRASTKPCRTAEAA
jgi:methanogenic corrinoid protein MtbC1